MLITAFLSIFGFVQGPLPNAPADRRDDRAFQVLIAKLVAYMQRFYGESAFTFNVEISVNAIAHSWVLRKTNRGVDMKKWTGGLAISAAVSLIFAAPAQACWSNAEEDAAKIANLNQMMMVSALRCRFGKENFLSDYNRFVKNNNALLGDQNAVIKDRFARVNGAAAAEREMDRYSIGQANRYGGGVEGLDCGQLQDIAHRLASDRFSVSNLATFADENAEQPKLPGGRCGVSIASRR
jgi:hypothetical protein